VQCICTETQSVAGEWCKLWFLADRCRVLSEELPAALSQTVAQVLCPLSKVKVLSLIHPSSEESLPYPRCFCNSTVISTVALPK